jgi:hypothetical protein
VAERPTHEDIIRQVEASTARTNELFHHLNARLGDLFQLAENLEVTIQRIDGRVEKVEAKVLKYDLMGARIMGAVGAFAVAASAIWWLIHEKIEQLLKGSAT